MLGHSSFNKPGSVGLVGIQSFPDCQGGVLRDPEVHLGPHRALELHTVVLPKEVGI